MWRRGLPGAAGLERERPRNCVPFRGCAGGLQGTTPVPAQGGAATREQAFALGPAPAARCTSDAVVAVTLQGRGGQREPRDLEQRKPPESPLQRDTCNVNSSRARRQPRRWGVRPKTAGRSPARGQDCRDAHRTRGPTPRPHAPAPRCRTSPEVQNLWVPPPSLWPLAGFRRLLAQAHHRLTRTGRHGWQCPCLPARPTRPPPSGLRDGVAAASLLPRAWRVCPGSARVLLSPECPRCACAQSTF